MGQWAIIYTFVLTSIICIIAAILIVQYKKKKQPKKIINSQSLLPPPEEFLFETSYHTNNNNNNNNRVVEVTTLSNIDEKTDIIIYIHVCMIGNWKNITSNILNQCEESSLFSKSTICHIVALGDVDELPHLLSILSSFPTCKLRYHSPDITRYERATLHIMWDDANHRPDNFKILYMHSKGVSKKNETVSRIETVQLWVREMLHHLVTDHELPIRLLDIVDACGVRCLKYPQLHFSGNFWWANSTYIKTLPRFISYHYLAPEMWLCCNQKITLISLCQDIFDQHIIKLLSNIKRLEIPPDIENYVTYKTSTYNSTP